MKGSITRRGKASWRLKYDTASADGSRRTQYVTVRCATKREAQAKLNEILAAIGRGEHVEPTKTTIAEHVRTRIDIWHSAGEIGAATFKRYGDMLTLHIRPLLGQVPLQKLSTVHVEGWHTKLRVTLGPKSIRHCHRLLGKALGDAVRHKIITHNVAGREGQRAPKVVRKEVEIIKKDQLGNAVEKLRGTTMFAPAMVALFCGLRAGEICALRWGRVDLDRKVIDVREAVDEVHGEPLAVKAPKTESSIRKVSMPDIVVEALRDHRRQQLEQRMAMGLGKLPADALVFATLGGGLKRPSNLSRDWRRTGAADVNFHALRHTHASQLIAAGLDLPAISKRLGHASPTITLQVYAHLFEQDDTKAAAIINAALGAISVPKSG